MSWCWEEGRPGCEILKYPEVEKVQKIVLVDWMPVQMDLCRTIQDIAALNQFFCDPRNPKLRTLQ